MPWTGLNVRDSGKRNEFDEREGSEVARVRRGLLLIVVQCLARSSPPGVVGAHTDCLIAKVDGPG